MADKVEYSQGIISGKLNSDALKAQLTDRNKDVNGSVFKDENLDGSIASRQNLSGNVVYDENVEYLDGELTHPLVVRRIVVENDYNNLKNHPSINGVELVGDKTLDKLGTVAKIEYGTVEEFKLRTGETSKAQTLYVRTDYQKDRDGNPLPGISIGDGKAYIGDLPIIADIPYSVIDHINNKIIHVSTSDRTNWDDKISCDIQDENLIFSI